MSELISIVINSNILRVALLNRSRTGTRVRRVLEKECPAEMVDGSLVKDPEGFAGFLKLQLNSAGIHAREAIFTLPADKLMTREVVLPDVGDARIRQIVDTNAGEYFPINLEDYVIGFYRIAAVRKNEEHAAGKDAADAEVTQPAVELENDADVELTSFGEEEEKGRSARKKKKKKKRLSRAEKKRLAQEAAENGESEGGRKKKERGEVRVMAIAAPNEMVRALYETAQYLHIRVESVDFIGNSVFRLAQMQVGREPTLTVDISGDHTALTFFDSGDMIMQRNIDFGMDQIVEIVARERWVSAERADEMLRRTELISEDLPAGDPIAEPLHFAVDMIRRTMIYYTRNRGMQPVEQVLLMGDAVYYKGVRELLEAQLAVPVTSLTQLKGVSIPRAASVRELAMRYLDNYGAVIAPVGFLSQELSRAREERSGKKLYRAILTAAAIGSAALIAVPAVHYFSMKKEVERLEKSVSELKDADALLASYEEAKLRGDDVRNVKGLTASHNDGLSVFIRNLEEVRPKGLAIENFTIDEGEISMTVLATGKDVIAAFLRALEGIEDISEVEASALTSYYEGNSETVACSVSCMLTNREKRDYEMTSAEEAGQ